MSCDRVQAEDHLQHERHLLNHLMNHVPDCIYFKKIEEVVFFGSARRWLASSGFRVLRKRRKTDADIFSSEHAEDGGLMKYK